MIDSSADLLERLSSSGDSESLLLYSELFCPRFSVFEGSVLLPWVAEDEESQKRFLHSLESGIPRSELESSYNTIEVGYLFNPDGRSTTEVEDLLIAERIATCWRGALKEQFPGKVFTVRVYSAEEFGSTAAVSFSESPANADL
jgi:hypothetical protein